MTNYLLFQCSVQCGKGIQTRRVFCGLFDGTSVLKVDDNRCDAEDKYNDTKTCEVPKEKCPSKWFAGPWSEVGIENLKGENLSHRIKQNAKSSSSIMWSYTYFFIFCCLR